MSSEWFDLTETTEDTREIERNNLRKTAEIGDRLQSERSHRPVQMICGRVRMNPIGIAISEEWQKLQSKHRV